MSPSISSLGDPGCGASPSNCLSGGALETRFVIVLKEGGDQAELVRAVKQLNNDQISRAVRQAAGSLNRPARLDGNWFERSLGLTDSHLHLTVGQRLLTILATNRKGCRQMGKVSAADSRLAQEIVGLGVTCRPVLRALGGRQSTILPHLAGWKKLLSAFRDGDPVAVRAATA